MRPSHPQARTLLAALDAAGGGALTTRSGARLAPAAPPPGAADADAVVGSGLEWFRITGTLPQIRSQADALAGATAVTAAAAAAAAARLADEDAPQWCVAPCDGLPALASARELAQWLARAGGGDGGRGAWARHERSGLRLPLSLVARLPGARAAPPPDPLSRRASGGRGRDHRIAGGDVVMEDAAAAVVALRAAPGYCEALDRAAAMEVDWPALAGGGGGGGQGAGSGAGAQEEEEDEEEYGRGAGLRRRLAGGSGGSGGSGSMARAAPPPLPAARGGGGGGGPAAAPPPHPLSPHPHPGPGLPGPRLLLVLDTNIVLEPTG
jgi:hypothetical protein